MNLANWKCETNIETLCLGGARAPNLERCVWVLDNVPYGDRVVNSCVRTVEIGLLVHIRFI